MSLFGSFFAGGAASDKEKTPHFEQYKKYNKIDIRKLTKRFDKYDRQKFKSTMDKNKLATGETIRGKEILEKVYEDHGFRFKREVKGVLTDKPKTGLSDAAKEHNIARTRMERLREEDRLKAHEGDYHHVESALTHDHARTSFFQPGSAEPNTNDVNHAAPTHNPGIFHKDL